MSDISDSLLRFGFAASKQRLAALVRALEAMDFTGFEELRGSGDLRHETAMREIPAEDAEFLKGVVAALDLAPVCMLTMPSLCLPPRAAVMPGRTQ